MELTIVENDDIKITATPGDTGVAVVSFSGVAFKIGDVPKEEFVKTLSGNQHGQYFVIDKNRTWYNSTSEEILSSLTPHLRNYDKVVTLGNSMGGFGAVYFAPRLPNCRRAISFVPQFSVDPEIVPNEDRWRLYRDRIAKWRIHHALEGAVPDLPLDIFFGGRQEQDALHEELFRQNSTPGSAIYVLDGAAHNLANYLRNGGVLKQVMDAIILNDASPGKISELLTNKSLQHTIFAPDRITA